MKSFKQHITEAFDKPYEWGYADSFAKPMGGVADYQKGDFKGQKTRFKTHDNREVEVSIFEWDIVPPKPKFPVFQNQGRVMEMHFAVETGDMMSGDITGKGDAMRIFATVLDILTTYIKKNKPDIIRVMGAKSEDAEIGSRLSLYKKLIRRYASKVGYKYDDNIITVGDKKTEAGLEIAVMKLVRKGYESKPKITIRSRSGEVR